MIHKSDNGNSFLNGPPNSFPAFSWLKTKSVAERLDHVIQNFVKNAIFKQVTMPSKTVIKYFVSILKR
jgi:hypothetical protein